MTSVEQAQCGPGSQDRLRAEQHPLSRAPVPCGPRTGGVSGKGDAGQGLAVGKCTPHQRCPLGRRRSQQGDVDKGSFPPRCT